MPAVSEKQRQMMAIAEHHPEKLYKRNRGVLSMSKEQLSEYASTHVKKKKKKRVRKKEKKKVRKKESWSDNL